MRQASNAALTATRNTIVEKFRLIPAAPKFGQPEPSVVCSQPGNAARPRSDTPLRGGAL
jgi:hypothetical protein